MASAIWNWLSFGFLPNLTPLAIALVRPSLVLDKIIDLSNSDKAPSTAKINRPCGLVVSIIGSASDRKPAPFSAMVARTYTTDSKNPIGRGTCG